MAVVWRGESLTFGELDDRANQLARTLAARGLAVGDRMVTLADTSLDIAPLFAGAAKAGVVFAPANPSVTLEETAEMAQAARPSILVADADRLAMAAEVGERLNTAVVDVDDLLAEAAGAPTGEFRQPDLTDDDLHVVFFTSGSTGRSKGVMLSHRVSVLRSHPGSQLEPRRAAVCTFPLFHMAGFTTGMNQWHARAACVFTSADAASIVEAVRAHGADRVNCIPGVWQRVIDHTAGFEGDEAVLAGLRFADTGTSATPPELLEAISTVAPNAAVRVFYGSTEAGSVCQLDHADVARKPGSCGRAGPLTAVRLVDGELCVSGPLLFDGYFDDPQATAEALVDGWYHTGDLAEIDGEGFVSIVGRVADVIRTGGEWVSPSQVEAVLQNHPAVADLAVIGVPDTDWGELVTVVVVPADPASPPSLQELLNDRKGALAKYKQPRRIVVVNKIPRTPATGQIRRRDLVAAITSPRPGSVRT